MKGLGVSLGTHKSLRALPPLWLTATSSLLTQRGAR
jgi:hypothetical protein